jgi:NAD(P)-dependent dehydrogenase (short-subunit alcohol dehydrogenase family)
MEFEGRVVVVTGAASGMGRATALRLAGAGARVVAVDANEQGLAELAHLGGDGVRPEAADVSSRDAVEAFVGRTVRDLGRLDGMVANAGIGHGSSFVDTTEEDGFQYRPEAIQPRLGARTRAIVIRRRRWAHHEHRHTYSGVTATECTAYSAAKVPFGC